MIFLISLVFSHETFQGSCYQCLCAVVADIYGQGTAASCAWTLCSRSTASRTCCPSSWTSPTRAAPAPTAPSSASRQVSNNYTGCQVKWCCFDYSTNISNGLRFFIKFRLASFQEMDYLWYWSLKSPLVWWTVVPYDQYYVKFFPMTCYNSS